MKRSRQNCAVVLGLVLALCSTAGAEEQTANLGEIVVTATRDELPLEQVGSSITVVTAKEIEQQQKRTVADALRMVPGLDVVRTGSMGGTTSIFMRGAKSEHTLVLIDGIEMNDPSSAGGTFNFGHLTVDNIERIEVLRGPQSTLYGSHAIGGVINIITKRGDGPPKGSIAIEAGSFATTRETASISGGSERVQFSLAASRLDTDGISSAGKRYGNHEKDGDQNSSITTRLGITPTPNSEIDLILKYGTSRNEIDNGGGVGKDDPNHIMRSSELFTRGQGSLSLFNNLWEQKMGVSYSDISWHDDNDPDAAHPVDRLRSSFQGQTVKFDWQHILNLHKTTTLTMGLETKEEQGSSDYHSVSSFGPYDSIWSKQTARTNSVYLQDQINIQDRWFSTIGVRLDDHDRFGSKATYRFTSAYLIKQSATKLKGSYGTGFKAPSLFQLYSSYGSPDLKPDKSIGWDLGLEQGLPFLKTTFGATWFKNRYSQMIDFDMSTWTYTNVTKARSQGLELTTQVQPLDELSLLFAYTYMETVDDTTGKELVRRPKNKLSFDANYRFLKKANLSLGLVYVGSRYNNAANTQKLGGYTLVNLAAAYDVTKSLQLFGRIDNLLDRQYEEVLGYGTPGIGAYGGVKVSF